MPSLLSGRYSAVKVRKLLYVTSRHAPRERDRVGLHMTQSTLRPYPIAQESGHYRDMSRLIRTCPDSVLIMS